MTGDLPTVRYEVAAGWLDRSWRIHDTLTTSVARYQGRACIYLDPERARIICERLNRQHARDQRKARP